MSYGQSWGGEWFAGGATAAQEGVIASVEGAIATQAEVTATVEEKLLLTHYALLIRYPDCFCISLIPMCLTDPQKKKNNYVFQYMLDLTTMYRQMMRNRIQRVVFCALL